MGVRLFRPQHRLRRHGVKAQRPAGGEAFDPLRDKVLYDLVQPGAEPLPFPGGYLPVACKTGGSGLSSSDCVFPRNY